MRNLFLLIALCFFLVPMLSAEESHAEPKATKSIEQLTATCIACHGDKGISPTSANPNLAGQHRDYLLISMQRYQNGMRKNAVMAGLVAGLTEEELKRIAVYYSQQEGLWDTAIPRFK